MQPAGARPIDASSTSAEVYTHKFFAPPSYPGAISRTGLIRRIFRKPPYGVVVVQAPAGHGKSTLLQQAKAASEKLGARTGWLSFDQADNDLRRFTVHMLALLQKLAPDAGDDHALEEDDVHDRLSDHIASRLAKSEMPVHLFFDEFQALHERGVLNVFRGLLERIPENTTLFIGSRTLPEIGLARPLVNNQALVLRADDLRFSQDEAQQFFSLAQDLSVSEQELSSIYRRTEGWPAALQLYRLSLSSPSVRRSLDDIGAYRPRELAEYLTDNVLTLQPAPIQSFLRRTAVLTRLSAELCNFVTGRQDSRSMLLHLESSGLFLRSLDSELLWFSYHPLFSTFLIEQVRSTAPESLTEAHELAAQWFKADGLHEDALHHAIAARNYRFATEIMDQWADTLVADGNLVTVERWADRLPLDEITRKPMLAIKIAWALIFLRRRHKLRPILAALESDPANLPATAVIRSMLAVATEDLPQACDIVREIDIEKQSPVGFRAFELSAAANLSAFCALTSGDRSTASRHLGLARVYGARGNAAFSDGYTLAVTGLDLALQGRLNEALECYRSGLIEHKLDIEKSFASASLVACYVHALYESNQIDAAASMFTRFHDVICDAVLPDFFLIAYIAMSRIHGARMDPQRAEHVLAEAEQIAHTAGWRRAVRVIDWERVRLALLAGDVERARVHASRIPRLPEIALPEGWLPMSEITEGDVIGTIRLALHSGDTETAKDLLATELAATPVHNRSYRVIKLLILEALTLQQRGQDNRAQRSLHRALQLAEKGGFVRLFLDEGEAILPLLQEQYTSSTHEDGGQAAPLRVFIGRLLEAGGEPAEQPVVPSRGSGQKMDPLTDREKEILIALANGLSNKEVARRIFVSENTVKFHLKNIFLKLSVSSRLHAIQAAQRMGLV
jgi:LuxR family maltose regulon positive regulatory protein